MCLTILSLYKWMCVFYIQYFYIKYNLRKLRHSRINASKWFSLFSGKIIWKWLSLISQMFSLTIFSVCHLKNIFVIQCIWHRSGVIVPFSNSNCKEVEISFVIPVIALYINNWYLDDCIVICRAYMFWLLELILIWL